MGEYCFGALPLAISSLSYKVSGMFWTGPMQDSKLDEIKITKNKIRKFIIF